MDKLRAAYRVTVIIGLAMMASLVVYFVIVGLFENGTIVLQGPPALPAGQLELLKFIFLGIAIAVVLLARPLSGRILNAGSQGIGHTRQPRFEPSAGPYTGPLTVAAVLTYALSEVPAILGLALYFLGRSRTDFYIFLLISLFSFSYTFPKFSQWEEWYRQQR
jgi:hypothetical protein